MAAAAAIDNAVINAVIITAAVGLSARDLT